MFEEIRTGILICLDINLDGKELEKFEGIRERVASRKPNKLGNLYYRDEDRQSFLRGGERGLLNKIASRQIEGLVYGVDGIYSEGINIAALVSPEELERIRQNPGMHISDEHKLDK